MKINEFFQEKLGANVRNPRWSWGAFHPVANRVFLRVWEDQIETHGQGKRVEIFWKHLRVKSSGSPERLHHIEAIKAGAEGFGIVCQAVDPSAAGARHIKSFDEAHLLRLGRFTENEDHIYAEIDGVVPLADLTHLKTAQSTLAKDLKAIIGKKGLNPTSKEALVNARVGQGLFRSEVLQMWNYRCSVTGSNTLDAIRASHIKPWRNSSDTERLDPHNGLPLVASLDALFDAGLISFDESGCLLFSSKLSQSERAIYGIEKKRLRQKVSPSTAAYLEHHRAKLFLK